MSPTFFFIIQIKASEMHTNHLRVWVNNIFICDKLNLEHCHLPTQPSQILLPPFCRFADTLPIPGTKPTMFSMACFFPG